MPTTYHADVVIAGGGLAGLTAAHELIDRGLRVLVLDRDAEDRLGGLAKLSFGGVMFVDTPHQRKLDGWVRWVPRSPLHHCRSTLPRGSKIGITSLPHLLAGIAL
jgi:flavin-dependent dehydrogenase